MIRIDKKLLVFHDGIESQDLYIYIWEKYSIPVAMIQENRSEKKDDP